MQDAINQAQKIGQQVQETMTKAFNNVQPEIANTQEFFQQAVKQAQENMTQVQAVMTQQPFNPFELQKVFMEQQLNFLKQANRQVEGQLEKAHQQFAQFGEKLNTSTKK